MGSKSGIVQWRAYMTGNDTLGQMTRRKRWMVQTEVTNDNPLSSAPHRGEGFSIRNENDIFTTDWDKIRFQRFVQLIEDCFRLHTRKTPNPQGMRMIYFFAIDVIVTPNELVAVEFNSPGLDNVHSGSDFYPLVEAIKDNTLTQTDGIFDP